MMGGLLSYQTGSGTLMGPVGHIVATGQNLTWSIEGGRSRTGKLRPPRYGALRYVVDAVRNTGDVPALRHGQSETLWRKLLGEGVSVDAEVRRAAQLATLQSVLTDPAPGPEMTWRTAASRVASPEFRLAEVRERSQE